uniref:Uncharacterized protein n=1 Tax=Rhizophora mucronata TaxID=61149 RepID=A0A2P2MLI6_RHIMU
MEGFPSENITIHNQVTPNHPGDFAQFQDEYCNWHSVPFLLNFCSPCKEYGDWLWHLYIVLQVQSQ